MHFNAPGQDPCKSFEITCVWLSLYNSFVLLCPTYFRLFRFHWQFFQSFPFQCRQLSSRVDALNLKDGHFSFLANFDSFARDAGVPCQPATHVAFCCFLFHFISFSCVSLAMLRLFFVFLPPSLFLLPSFHRLQMCNGCVQCVLKSNGSAAFRSFAGTISDFSANFSP